MTAPASLPRSRETLLLIAALAWLLAFCGHFIAQPVAGDVPLGRIDVLADSSWLLLDHVLPSAGEPSRDTGWRYFPQRLDLLFVAGTMLLAAWTAGELCLRALRIDTAARAERLVFAFGLGLSAWTIVTLGLGLAGALWRWLFVALMAGTIGCEMMLRSRRRRHEPRPRHTARVALAERRFLGGPRLPLAIGIVVAPFLLAMLLGAMLPTTDFDVKEYHLQGPKEWFQQGRITFLPHNVYTSFPFLTELLPLWGMVLRGDWYRGALIGQIVLMTFAPLTALAVYVIGRTNSETAGWIGAGVFLTIPWVYRISTIAYAEGGLTFFLAAAFIAWLSMQCTGTARQRVLLCGLLSGSALACKYPGLVSVTVPLGAAVVWTAGRAVRRQGVSPTDQATADRFDTKGALRAAAVFGLGAAITFGPWALKNQFQTGNPVYPLGYTVFGGVDWTPELNQKWRNAHKAQVRWDEPAGIPADLWNQAQEVAVRSKGQSPLVFALAPLAVLAFWPGRRREGETPAPPRRDAGPGLPRQPPKGLHPPVPVLIVYAAWLFLTWWGLTHRIDRFWLPMLPIVCALGGIGGALVVDLLDALFDGGRRMWTRAVGLVLASLAILATAYNLTVATSGLSGNNAYLLEEEAARRFALRQTPSIALLSARLPDGARVLLVGEAAVFDATFELRYNTVFDFELLQEWATNDPQSLYREDIPLKPREEILARLRAEGITHVFVNWLEILRYREAGSYTYADFISPRTLQKLVDLGVLAPVQLSPQERLADLELLSPGKRQEIERWAPELRTTVVIDGSSIAAVRAYELYTVATE